MQPRTPGTDLRPRWCFVLGRDALAIAALIGSIAALTGCEGEARSSETYPVRIAVQSDPGKVVAGAVLKLNTRELATSDATGIATLNLTGREGDSVDVTVACPEGYESPSKPISIRLTQRGGSSKAPEYPAVCAPGFRNVVVAVRADNGARIPVTYLGKPIARTDEAGAAHVLLRMRPGDQFELGLDTTGFPKHHPQQPKASFAVGSAADELQHFDVRFEVDKPKAIVRRAPQGPKRL